MSSFTPTISWFATHELRLQWRDLSMMLTGGSRKRAISVGIFAIIFLGIMHWIASVLIGGWAANGAPNTITLLSQITGSGLLFATMSLSQAMESVTRAYYARADLDLILSSPASAQKVFIVRTGTIALTSVVMMAAIMSPFINMLIYFDGWQWLWAYPAIAALSLITTSLAVLITLGLFRTAGPKRTRAIAQILAAIVGAALIVGIQIAVIMRTGTTSSVGGTLSTMFSTSVPNPASWVWIPARAALGDISSITMLFAVAAFAFASTMLIAAPGFAKQALAARSNGEAQKSTKRAAQFKPASQAQMLRQKEWLLLKRDPWLISQSLMQLLYLLPPAAMLWLNYGDSGGTLPIVAAIITMAAAQLAGGLAWLTISGEDAHDLILTAPIDPKAILNAKIQSVLIVIAAIITPFALAVALSDLRVAATLVLGVGLATASAVFIQLMFRVRAKRSQFARRQTASRVATIAEALTSITWAGATGLAVVQPIIGLFAAIPALIILGLIWLAQRNAHA